MHETEREIPGKKWDAIEESKLVPFRIVDLEFEDLIYIYNVFGYFVKITEPTRLQEELVLPVFETRVERVALTENTYHILQNSWIKY